MSRHVINQKVPAFETENYRVHYARGFGYRVQSKDTGNDQGPMFGDEIDARNACIERQQEYDEWGSHR